MSWSEDTYNDVGPGALTARRIECREVIGGDGKPLEVEGEGISVAVFPIYRSIDKKQASINFQVASMKIFQQRDTLSRAIKQYLAQSKLISMG